MDFWSTDQWMLRLVLAAAFAFMGVTHFLPRVARTMAAGPPLSSPSNRGAIWRRLSRGRRA